MAHDTTRTTVGATLFSILLVGSMIAAGVALAPAGTAAAPGAAAATPALPSPSAAIDGPGIAQSEDGDFDRDVSGSDVDLVFRGQVVRSTDFAAGESVQLRRETASGSSFVTEEVVGDDGTVVFETESRETGTYFVRGPSADTSNFEIAVQSWDGAFEPRDVSAAGANTETTHTVETNRGGAFAVEVTAERDGRTVDGDDLADVVADDESVDGDAVVVTGVREGSDLALDFDGADPGTYDVTVSVRDTTVSETETIEVSAGTEGGVAFGQSFITVERGNAAAITVELEGSQDEAYLRVGDEDVVGYAADVYVDANGEDEVTVAFDTYAAGTDRTGDIVAVADPDSDAEVRLDGQTREDLSSVLATGSYPMELDAAGFAAIDDDASDDIGDVEIQDRSTGESRVWTGSSEVLSEVDSASDVAAAAANGTLEETDEITTGDVLVYEIEATGLDGIVDRYGLLGTGADGDFAGLDVQIRQTSDTTAPNAQRKTVDFAATERDVDVIAGEESYYVVVALSDLVTEDGREVDPGDAYRVRFRLKDERLLDPDPDAVESSDDVSEFYETTTSQFSVVEAVGAFDEPVEVEPADDQVVTGTTNVAPGNELMLRARSDQDVSPGFIVSAGGVVVDANGTFTADGLDFSEASVGDEFTIRTRNDPFDESAEAEGVVVEDLDGGDDSSGDDGSEDGSSGDDGSEDDGSEDDGTADDSAGDGSEDDGSEDDGGTADDGSSDGTEDDGGTRDDVPGFGVLAALLALCAAALAAARTG